MRREEGHPDEIELDALRAGEAAADVEAHVDACETCRARLTLLERLAAELAAEPVVPFVPRERDQAVLHAIRRRASELRPKRGRAVAAALLLIVGAAYFFGEGLQVRTHDALIMARRLIDTPPPRPASSPRPPTPSIVQGPSTDRLAARRQGDTPDPEDLDLDGNGRLDVLDAFTLARHVEAGSAPATWDVDGDGRVDGSDVDAVARAAVRVKGSG